MEYCVETGHMENCIGMMLAAGKEAHIQGGEIEFTSLLLRLCGRFEAVSK